MPQEKTQQLQRLENKHKDLDIQLEMLYKSKQADAVKITNIKKQKLNLKEQIVKLNKEIGDTNG